eukprot:178922-Rhodomonas_salina.1
MGMVYMILPSGYVYCTGCVAHAGTVTSRMLLRSRHACWCRSRHAHVTHAPTGHVTHAKTLALTRRGRRYSQTVSYDADGKETVENVKITIDAGAF